MKNVIEKLKEYSNQIDLSNRFDFIVDPSDSIFTESETQSLLSEKTLFDQNVRLKWILKEKYFYFWANIYLQRGHNYIEY
ncbi:MAG: hypothetical protein R2863_08005 [Candidatus Kapaibacterium sp.]|nr:hypothetical protein [Ignavibacteriota bacterium]MCB9220483.1 hypothetical protein [Ignavibacteria bacterium]